MLRRGGTRVIHSPPSHHLVPPPTPPTVWITTGTVSRLAKLIGIKQKGISLILVTLLMATDKMQPGKTLLNWTHHLSPQSDTPPPHVRSVTLCRWQAPRRGSHRLLPPLLLHLLGKGEEEEEEDN